MEGFQSVTTSHYHPNHSDAKMLLLNKSLMAFDMKSIWYTWLIARDQWVVHRCHFHCLCYHQNHLIHPKTFFSFSFCSYCPCVSYAFYLSCVLTKAEGSTWNSQNPTLTHFYIIFRHTGVHRKYRKQIRTFFFLCLCFPLLESLCLCLCFRCSSLGVASREPSDFIGFWTVKKF